MAEPTSDSGKTRQSPLSLNKDFCKLLLWPASLTIVVVKRASEHPHFASKIKGDSGRTLGNPGCAARDPKSHAKHADVLLRFPVSSAIRRR